MTDTATLFQTTFHITPDCILHSSAGNLVHQTPLLGGAWALDVCLEVSFDPQMLGVFHVSVDSLDYVTAFVCWVLNTRKLFVYVSELMILKFEICRMTGVLDPTQTKDINSRACLDFLYRNLLPPGMVFPQ